MHLPLTTPTISLWSYAQPAAFAIIQLCRQHLPLVKKINFKGNKYSKIVFTLQQMKTTAHTRFHLITQLCISNNSLEKSSTENLD